MEVDQRQVGVSRPGSALEVVQYCFVVYAGEGSFGGWVGVRNAYITIDMWYM